MRYVHLGFKATTGGVGKVKAEFVVSGSVTDHIVMVVSVDIGYHDSGGVFAGGLPGRQSDPRGV